MSYRVGTTHYNLPQTEGTDKRDWADTNQAFADIDAAIYEAGSDAGLALSAAQTAQTSADGAVADAASAVTTANAASASATSASEAAALARTEAQSAVTTAGQANTTAQAAQTTATNADTVALAAQSNIGTMANLQTTDKTSLVAAINEVLSQIGGGGMPELNFANPLHSFASSATFTATKDCYLLGSFGINGSSAGSTVKARVTIDGTEAFMCHMLNVSNQRNSATCVVPCTLIKAGSTVAVTSDGSAGTGIDTVLLTSLHIYDVVS